MPGLPSVWAAAVVAASAAPFVIAGAWAAGGWPLPLDDAYIYFGHARAIAEGHPGAWVSGQGYSSGATALAYPFLLAPFWLVGLRGSALAAAAFVIAAICAFDLARSLEKLAGRQRLLAAPLALSVPLLGWSLWSGMEVALFGALLGRALVASHHTACRDVAQRRRWQWRSGTWLALLVLTRPEAIPLSFALSLATLWAARSLATAPSLARTAGPWVVALLAQASLQFALTGEWLAAGAIRKGLWSPPAAEATAIAVAWLQNLLVLVSQGFLRALGGPLGALTFAGLASFAMTRPATRRLGLALAFGVAGGLLLVCANQTARYQHYRYVAPLIAMSAALAILGLSSMKTRWAGVVGLLAVVLPLRELRGEVRHFARASANIAEQHLVVAEMLAAMPPGPVFVNDAGAIPYLSGRRSIDGLGLGGYRGLPFARASLLGEAAVIELIERLPASERPRHLAVYAAWWPELLARFGHPVATVRIAHNVICAAEEKVIFAADWTLLGEEKHGLDVGDLVAEQAFDHDGAGAIVSRTARTQDGLLWDAGRSYPPGGRERFRVPRDGPLILESRTDAAARLVVEHWRGEARLAAQILEVRPAADTFADLRLALPEARSGDYLTILVLEGPWRSFHHRFANPQAPHQGAAAEKPAGRY